jgi:hypothetical protein
MQLELQQEMESNTDRVCVHVYQSCLLINDCPGFGTSGRTVRHPQHCYSCHDYFRIRPRLRWVHFVLTADGPHSFIIAFGPLFIGPFSEIFGRSHVLQIANLWYLGTYFHLCFWYS